MIQALMEEGLFTVRQYGTTGKDPLGKPSRGIVNRVVVDGRLEQTKSDEPLNEQIVINFYRGFAPVDAPISAGSEIECQGSVYTVIGAPSIERIPGFRALSNLAFRLQYVGPVTG